MADTNYTPEMLAALERAIATGTKEVYYGDKRVVYRDLNEMLRIRDLMKQALGLGGQRKVIRPEFNKGL